jgi:CRP-like cAMP-binding protein
MTLEERLHALALVPEFRDLPPDARGALAAAMRAETFRAGEIVTAVGEPADRVFVLCAGSLDVMGDSGVKRRLEPGTLLGEIAFFADELRTATVLAATDCELLSLPFANFRAFLLTNPEAALILTGRIVRMLRA